MKTKVLIIGTGPYGISIANELYSRHIDFVIVGKVFELWNEHTLDTMAIRSDWHTSEIYDPKQKFDFKKYLKSQHNNYEEILKKRIPIDIFRNYLKFVESNLPYDIVKGRVTNVTKEKDKFKVTVDDTIQIDASKVIVATGIGSHIYLPKAIKTLGKDYYIHTWETNVCKDWKDKELLVIGNGQSAAETIVQLKPENKVTWVRRKDSVFYSEPLNLPVFLFKVILHVSPYFYFLPRGIKDKFGKKFVISTITPDLKEGVMNKDVVKCFNDVKELELEIINQKIFSKKLDKSFDQIIAATGYRYHLNNLSFLDDRLKRKIQNRKGIPNLKFDFQSSVSNLFFVGGIAEPTYGPAQRFIMGSSHAAIRIGKVMANET